MQVEEEKHCLQRAEKTKRLVEDSNDHHPTKRMRPTEEVDDVCTADVDAFTGLDFFERGWGCYDVLTVLYSHITQTAGWAALDFLTLTCKTLHKHPTVRELKTTIVKHYLGKTEERLKNHLDAWGLREKLSTFLPLVRGVIGSDWITPRFLREVGLIRQDCLECPLENLNRYDWRIPIHISSRALYQSAGPIFKYLVENDPNPCDSLSKSDPVGEQWSFPPLVLPTCVEPDHQHDETPQEFRDLLLLDYLDLFTIDTHPQYAIYEALEFFFRTYVERFLEGPLHYDLDESKFIGDVACFMRDCPPNVITCHSLTEHHPAFRSGEAYETFLRKRSGFKETDLLAPNDRWAREITFMDRYGLSFSFSHHNLPLPRRNFRGRCCGANICDHPPIHYYVEDWLGYFLRTYEMRSQYQTPYVSSMDLEEREEKKEDDMVEGITRGSVLEKYVEETSWLPPDFSYENRPTSLLLPKFNASGLFLFDGERIYCASVTHAWNYVKYVKRKMNKPK